MANGVVVLDTNRFRASYPEFKNLTDFQIENAFYEATIRLNNTEKSPVKDLQRREFLLYLAMAHICALNNQIATGNGSVGRLGSATQGSVSVSLDYGSSSSASKWWEQTPYGAKYWSLIKQYLTATIVSLHEQLYVNRTNSRWQ